MRTAVIAGNWKMNKTVGEALEFIEDLKPLVSDVEHTVVLCAPYICLPALVECAKGSNVHIGAQNMHFEDSGAYTGEVSALMLKDLGVEYVILGHSERRAYYAEDDASIQKKALKALEVGLIPIICVGESLQQREAGVTAQWIKGQTKAALEGIPKAQLHKVIIAYEPIWAIGTGKTATAQDANEVIGAIRDTLREIAGDALAEAIRIQYGGSMNPKNARELMAMEHIDGGLIGGASLKVDDFDAVVHYNR